MAVEGPHSSRPVPHHGCVLIPGTVRACIAQLLADATEPVTTRRLAELADTTPPQAARALRRLEGDGAAVRHLAAGGCYAWTTTGTAPARPSRRLR